MHATEVADRVHRLAHAHVNCYLIDDEEGVTLVDAGLPSMWNLMTDTLRRLGRGPGDVRALVLTHGHFDHVGFARRARVDLGSGTRGVTAASGCGAPVATPASGGAPAR